MTHNLSTNFFREGPELGPESVRWDVRDSSYTVYLGRSLWRRSRPGPFDFGRRSVVAAGRTRPCEPHRGGGQRADNGSTTTERSDARSHVARPRRTAPDGNVSGAEDGVRGGPACPAGVRDRATQTRWPACRPSSAALPRLSWTQQDSSPARSTSTLTSKPRWVTRATVPSTALGLGLPSSTRVHDEVVRAHPLAVEPRRRAEEGQHELVGRVVVHVGRRAHLLQVPVVDDGQAVGHLHGLLLVVGDEHRGDLAACRAGRAATGAAACAPGRRARRRARRAAAPWARWRAPGRGPCAGAGRPRAATGSARRGGPGPPARAARPPAP